MSTVIPPNGTVHPPGSLVRVTASDENIGKQGVVLAFKGGGWYHIRLEPSGSVVKYRPGMFVLLNETTVRRTRKSPKTGPQQMQRTTKSPSLGPKNSPSVSPMMGPLQQQLSHMGIGAASPLLTSNTVTPLVPHMMLEDSTPSDPAPMSPPPDLNLDDADAGKQPQSKAGCIPGTSILIMPPPPPPLSDSQTVYCAGTRVRVIDFGDVNQNRLGTIIGAAGGGWLRVELDAVSSNQGALCTSPGSVVLFWHEAVRPLSMVPNQLATPADMAQLRDYVESSKSDAPSSILDSAGSPQVGRRRTRSARAHGEHLPHSSDDEGPPSAMVRSGSDGSRIELFPSSSGGTAAVSVPARRPATGLDAIAHQASQIVREQNGGDFDDGASTSSGIAIDWGSSAPSSDDEYDWEETKPPAPQVSVQPSQQRQIHHAISSASSKQPRKPSQPTSQTSADDSKDAGEEAKRRGRVYGIYERGTRVRITDLKYVSEHGEDCQGTVVFFKGGGWYFVRMDRGGVVMFRPGSFEVIEGHGETSQDDIALSEQCGQGPTTVYPTGTRVRIVGLKHCALAVDKSNQRLGTITEYKGGGWYFIHLDDDGTTTMYRRGSIEVISIPDDAGAETRPRRHSDPEKPEAKSLNTVGGKVYVHKNPKPPKSKVNPATIAKKSPPLGPQPTGPVKSSGVKHPVKTHHKGLHSSSNGSAASRDAPAVVPTSAAKGAGASAVPGTGLPAAPPAQVPAVSMPLGATSSNLPTYTLNGAHFVVTENGLLPLTLGAGAGLAQPVPASGVQGLGQPSTESTSMPLSTPTLGSAIAAHHSLAQAQQLVQALAQSQMIAAVGAQAQSGENMAVPPPAVPGQEPQVPVVEGSTLGGALSSHQKVEAIPGDAAAAAVTARASVDLSCAERLTPKEGVTA